MKKSGMLPSERIKLLMQAEARERDGPICGSCDTTSFMRFECVECCVRWLRQMSVEEMKLNAPTIVSVMGEDHMERVRQAIREEAKTKKQQY